MHDYEIGKKFLTPHTTINCRGRLVDLSHPLVMGILNVTPDSFFDKSRKQSLEEVLARAEQILEEGGDIIDVGAYSSRPGADHISEEEEGERLWPVLSAIRERWPDVLISLDTFRGAVARRAVEEFQVDMINDISGGSLDPEMLDTVVGLNVPYILMHIKGNPRNMQKNPVYQDVTGEVILYLAEKIDYLRGRGLSDIIIDPGFGFAKTVDHNYELLNNLEQFQMFELPILVGVSRKSMIYKILGGSPADALNGTTVLNTIALTKGAGILRVHDVKEAVECINLVTKTLH